MVVEALAGLPAQLPGRDQLTHPLVHVEALAVGVLEVLGDAIPGEGEANEIDEPALVMRAQRDLFVENWGLLRLLALPSLILVVPSIVLLSQMDACYGRAQLRVGGPAVGTPRRDGAVPARSRGS